jgi:hypothetical protein
LKDHLTSPVFPWRCTHTKFSIGTNGTNLDAGRGGWNFPPYSCQTSTSGTRASSAMTPKVGIDPKPSDCTLDKIEATRALHGPDEIKKYASVVILQIGQVVGEIGEVVADASLQVLANAVIDRGQRTAAALI